VDKKIAAHRTADVSRAMMIILKFISKTPLTGPLKHH
jgi:hypothetical protein